METPKKELTSGIFPSVFEKLHWKIGHWKCIDLYESHYSNKLAWGKSQQTAISMNNYKYSKCLNQRKL